MKTFEQEIEDRLERNGHDRPLQEAAAKFTAASIRSQYSYNFSWLGRPIIQYPQDIVAMQELIWTVQPDLIIETGIAHGGSLIFSASMLELNAACGGPADARVVGVDIDIRAHNRTEIEAHPMFRRITIIQGSSVDPEVVSQVGARAAGRKCVLVCLDIRAVEDADVTDLAQPLGAGGVGVRSQALTCRAKICRSDQSRVALAHA